MSESGCAHTPHWPLSGTIRTARLPQSVKCNPRRRNAQPRQLGPQPRVHGGVTRGPRPCRRTGGADGHAWAVPWMDTIHHPACLFPLSLPIRVELLTEVELLRAERPIAERPPLQSRHCATENSLGEKNPRTANLNRIPFSRKPRDLCARCRPGAGQGRRGARRLAG